jgi:hypothetical protein
MLAAAGSVALAKVAGGAVNEEEAKAAVSGAVSLKLAEKMRIDAQSVPVKVRGADLHIVSIGTATFDLDKDSRLSARLNAAVCQYAKVVYRVSAAVFDASGQLLGAAVHDEAVERYSVGKELTLLKEIALDFGVSKAYRGAKLVAVAISEPEVPTPG